MVGNKGGLAIESLALLVTVLITSAAVFYLVQSGIVTVEGSGNGAGSASLQDQFLNVEFFPIAQGGTLAIQDFTLCYEDDVNHNSLLCDQERELFFVGDQVHFSFQVISSSYLGSIELFENYQLLGPGGDILLDVNAKEDFEFEADADESVEGVFFHDYFILDDSDPVGVYTLELVITNPLIGKEVVLRKEVVVTG